MATAINNMVKRLAEWIDTIKLLWALITLLVVATASVVTAHIQINAHTHDIASIKTEVKSIQALQGVDAGRLMRVETLMETVRDDVKDIREWTRGRIGSGGNATKQP